MMVKSATPVQATETPERTHIDWVKWMIWGGIGFAVAVSLSGLAFLIGYLIAFHNAAQIIHNDQALIMSLRQKLQVAHTKLANQRTNAPSVHGSWWLWWIGLPLHHLTHG